MSLKDYRYNLTGDNIEIAGITLKNPEFKVSTIYYDTTTMIADIELYITENGGTFTHSRTINLTIKSVSEVIDKDGIDLAIKEMFPDAVQTDGKVKGGK